MFCSVGMFFGKGLGVSGARCKDNVEEFVVVLIVVPMSEASSHLHGM